MKRRIATFAVVFAVSMLIGIQAVEVAMANPFVWSTKPNQENPKLTIISPQNYSLINSTDSLYLNFTAISPQSWIKDYESGLLTIHVGYTDYVDIYIDGNLCNHLIDEHNYYSPDYDFTNFSVKLNQTSTGSHLANVTIYAHILYLGPPIDPSHVISHTTSDGPLYEYPMVVSDTVNFTINQQNEPNLSSNSITILAITSVIAIVAVVSVLLVYFMRRRGKP
jgi:hypothetical protein